VILAVGEALMEFRRSTPDGRLARPGDWAGPFPSGAPAIFASVAARLGQPVALAAAVGADAFGDALRARLGRDGVRCEGVRVVADRRTAVAFVAYRDAGERDFWFSVPDSAAVLVEPAAVGTLAARASWLHACGSTLAFGGAVADAVVAAAEQVLRAGGRLSVDPNLRPDASPDALARTARLARAADVVFPSEGELEALGLDVRELVAGGATVCATRGAGGARVAGPDLGGRAIDVPAPVVDEVDPTGAGDTFAAAFVAAVRTGAGPVAAARAACAVAARSVGVLGAMEAAVGAGDVA
jgi:fructokinase